MFLYSVLVQYWNSMNMPFAWWVGLRNFWKDFRKKNDTLGKHPNPWRIHGTGIFTYICHKKPTIPVGKYTSPTDPSWVWMYENDSEGSKHQRPSCCATLVRIKLWKEHLNLPSLKLTFSPLKMMVSNRNLRGSRGSPIFRGYVSFREGLRYQAGRDRDECPHCHMKISLVSNHFIDTVDGWNPAPLDMENLPLFTTGFIHPRWLFGISSINSIILEWF